MKLFIDRFYGFDTSNTKILKDKKFGVILSYADADPYLSGAVNAIRTLEDTFDYTSSNLCSIVYGTEIEEGERSLNHRKNIEVINLAKAICENDNF